MIEQAVAAINARIARLGARHDRALAQALQHPPKAGRPMTWSERRKIERYRRAGLKLLSEVLSSADELGAMIDRLLDAQDPPLTDAERAQVKDALVPDWARQRQTTESK